MGDFIHRHASTPYAQTYLAAGAACQLLTNSPFILKAAGDSFLLEPDSPGEPDLTMRLWVDSRPKARPPWPKPYVRGLNHIVYAGFDPGSSIVINLTTRRIMGRLSPDFAEDTAYWNRVVFPMLLSITAASMGITEVHCACVAKDDQGLLLAGPTRSGKSTLTLALGLSGFGFLADDRTFCSLRHRKLSAYGLLIDLKLRSDSTAWFPDAATELRGSLWNNADERRFEPESLHLSRVRYCEPRCIVFLERHDSTSLCLAPLSRIEAGRRIQADLMAELPEASDVQSVVMSKLVELPCFVLRYGGNPWTVADKLVRLFDEVVNGTTAK
jgi:hypothetical protein